MQGIVVFLEAEGSARLKTSFFAEVSRRKGTWFVIGGIRPRRSSFTYSQGGVPQKS